MTHNATLYRLALSTVGGALIGVLGLLVGAAWAAAVDASVLAGGAMAGIAAFAWGAVVVQLTPTGGVIMENRTTVNYAVFALHAWYAVFLCIVALFVLAVRSAL